MQNKNISYILMEIGFLLELKEEGFYKGRAYKKAAHQIAEYQDNVAELIKNNQQININGVGESIKKTIEEIIFDGHSSLLRKLHQEVPIELLQLLAVPGIGIQVLKKIIKYTSATTLDDVVSLVKRKEIRKLPGLGSKTELALLRGIDFLKEKVDTFPIGIAMPIAKEIMHSLEKFSILDKYELVGDLRRGVEMVGSIDFLVSTSNFSGFLAVLSEHPHLKHLCEQKDDFVEFSSWLGLKIKFYNVELSHFAISQIKYTGSQKHWETIRRELDELGLKEYVYDNEEDVYKVLKLPLISPEIRETGQEVIDVREIGQPNLINTNDIKGDLHIHTYWSDGVNSIDDMISKGIERGYEYMAITDHSQSLKIAGGLTIDKLRHQAEEIESSNHKYHNFKILKGVEADILKDGKLDYDDEILQDLDIVVASIHTGFKLEKEAMTERIIQALKNPNVDILAHPTGRLLGRRPAYEVDIEKVIEYAVDTNTILEINASPDRLDLKAEYVKLAKDLGAKIAINTDAHETEKLNDMEYGVVNGRRGWLTKEDVVNTWSLDRLMEWLGNYH